MNNGDASAETPEGIKAHEGDYQPNVWEQYELWELGMWVHLLAKRAGHRADMTKRDKDLYDAQNYLSMMQAKLDAQKDSDA